MKLIILIVICVIFAAANALRCPPCKRHECPYKYCPGKTQVLDVCRCCYVCSKQEWEECGGPWGITGTCDPSRRKKLTCVKDPICGGKTDGLDFNKSGICLSFYTINKIEKLCKKGLLCSKNEPFYKLLIKN